MALGSTFQPVTISDSEGNPIPLGQAASTSSLPVVIASDQSVITISDGGGSLTVDGTVTANIGTTNGLALNATLTGGTQTTRITDGTNTATVKAASTAPVAGDQALVVAISPNSVLTATNPSVSTNNTAVPGSSTQIGGSDGTNLQNIRVFDGDTGGGTQYVLGAILRKSASGGTVEAGTSADPIRVDPTGTTTQPVTGTVTSNIGTTNGLALDATLTGGTQTTRITDGTNTTAVKAASTASVATDPALVVAISPNNSVAITASSLPLPTGAATQTTLSSIDTKTLAAGQAVMAASSPVVIASNQTAIPVTDNGGSLTVDGTITANIGTTGGLALDATLTGGTQTSRVTDGTNTATVKAGSTAPVAGDPALVVSISPNSTLTAVNPSVGTNNSAIPGSSTQIGGSDGTNLQIIRVFDGDTGAGSQYVLGAILRKSASGGTVEAGTSADPLRVDPTGTTTQPISGTVTANIGTTGGLALNATLTGGTQTTRITDGTNTATVKAASTAPVAADQALVVAISPNSVLTATNPSVSTNNSAVPGSSTQIGGSDGTNLQNIRVFDGDTGGGTQYVLGAILRKSASGGTVEAGTSADPLRVDPTGTTTQPISAASLPLPTGAATQTTLASIDTKTLAAGQAVMASSSPVVIASNQTSIPVTDNGGSLTVDGTVTANQGTAAALAGNWPVRITDGTNTMPTGDVASRSLFNRITDGTSTAAVKAASISAVAADPALVVAISPNNTIPVSAASLPLPTGAATQTTLASIDTKTLAAGQAAMAASSPVVIASNQTAIPVTDNGGSLTVDGTVTANQGTAAALAGNWPVRITDGTNTMPTGDAVARGIFHRITDGTSTAAVKAASTAAVAADPALVVAISPNNTIPISMVSGGYGGQVEGRALSGTAAVGNPVLMGGLDSTTVRSLAVDTLGRLVMAPAGASSDVTPGLSPGYRSTAAITRVPVQATTYTEQAANAQRSILSANAADTAAGTGARTVRITYYTATWTGPFTETITLNGVTAVNTVSTTICYIEKIEVVTVGSSGSNTGIISLRTTTGGGGSTFASIAALDNQTFYTHHYVATGITCYVTGLSVGHNGTTVGSGGLFIVRAQALNVANAVDDQIGDFLRLYGQSSTITRVWGTALEVVGPARITVYVLPETATATIYRANIDYYDQ